MEMNEEKSENFVFKRKISLHAEEIVGTKAENQESTTAGVMKELEAVTYNPVMQASNNIKDKIYFVIKKNSQKLDDKKVCEIKNTCHEEIQAENSICKKTEVKIDETNKISNKRSNRSRQLSVHNKKDNLKKVKSLCNKIMKPKATRKLNKTAESLISNDIKYEEIGDKEYSKESSLSASSSFACSNNANNMLNKNIPYYRVAMQEQSHPYSLDSTNALQYMENNNLRHMNQQMIFMNHSNRWVIVPENDRNFALNTVTNVQNEIEQNSFINDRQYCAHTAGDYNWKQNENPHLYSPVNPTDPYRMFSMENKYCSCNACINNKSNNMYVDMQGFPKVSATFQQKSNNTAGSCTPLITTSGHLLNAAVEPYNNTHNYQSPQMEYNFKKSFYRDSNVMNYVYNNGYNSISVANEGAMSPLNNWYMNSLTSPYNNLNIPHNTHDTPVTSDVLPSRSLYIGAANAHFNNYYDRDMVKVNVLMDQYAGRENFNPYTMSSFENQPFAIEVRNDNSNEFMNASQFSRTDTRSSVDNNIMPDITNCHPETNATDVSEEPLSCVSPKKKDWLSDVINTIDENNF